MAGEGVLQGRRRQCSYDQSGVGGGRVVPALLSLLSTCTSVSQSSDWDGLQHEKLRQQGFLMSVLPHGKTLKHIDQ